MTETLIPRTRLFGNPTRAQGQISPDGRWLSWLAPKDGVLNIWVAPAGDMGAARVITDDRKRGIRFHAWANSSAHVLYIQDEGGTEDWHVYAVPVEGGAARDLTPLPGVNARIQELSLDEPHVLAVGLNDRDKAWHDVYRIDIRTGERKLLFENRQELAEVMLDRQLRPRLAIKTRDKEGGHIVYRIAGADLEQIMVIEHEDDLTTHPIGFTQDAGTLYWISSVGRDKAALVARDWQTGTDRLLAEHPKADISRVMANPKTRVVEAVGAQHLTLDWIPLDERIAADLKHLQGALPGEVEVADRTLDDSRWIVAAGAAEAPTTYHLYDRGSGSITELFATRPELKVYRLAPMRGEVVRARDGLELVSYLTLPEGARPRPKAPLPMVLLVHGGPWARDEYGFNPAPPVAGQPRLGRAFGQLPRLDRLRQGVRQRRRPRVGPQDARRPARRGRVGRAAKASPTPAASPSWAAPTAATRRWRASPSRPTCSAAASTSSARPISRRCWRPSRPTGRRSSRTWPGGSAIRAPRRGASC